MKAVPSKSRLLRFSTRCALQKAHLRFFVRISIKPNFAEKEIKPRYILVDFLIDGGAFLWYYFEVKWAPDFWKKGMARQRGERMAAILCLCIPPLLLAIIREKAAHSRKGLYERVIAYVISWIVLNGMMVLVLNLIVHNHGQLVLKLNHYPLFAVKYAALSMAFALAEPFAEKGLRWAGLRFLQSPKTAGLRNLCRRMKRHPVFGAICVVEVLILAWIVSQCLRPAYNLAFTASDFTVLDSDVQLVQTDDESYYEITNEDAVDSIKILSVDDFKLYPGAYNVTISYASDTADDPEDSLANSTGSLTLNSAKHGTSYCAFNQLSLRDALTEESQTVQINSPVALEDMSLSILYNGAGTLSIYSIELSEIVVYKYVLLAIMALLFLLLDAAVLSFGRGIFRMKDGILCLICLAAALPFLANFVYSGHDITFHLNRIVCLADELKQGNYFPAIFSTALNGYGYANPLFYGQVFLYLPAVLYCCGFSLTFSYNVYIILFSVATCLIMYGSSLRIFKKARPALLCAALYTLSAVRLTNIFTRSALGEFTAQTFLPLVILGVYNIYSAERGETLTLKKYLPLIAGFTGVFLSHTLTALMCALLLVAFCIVNLKKTLEKTRMAALCKAAGLTLLINLSSLVPFIDSYSMNLAVKDKVNYIQGHGTYLVQLFNVIVDNFQQSSVSNTAGNEMSFSIGFSITLGLILYVFCLVRGRKAHTKSPVFTFSKLCFAFTLATLLLSLREMPYNALDFLPETLYSLLTVYQFPWRWLVFATLFGTYCTAYAVGSMEKFSIQKYTPALALFAVAAALCVNTGQIYADQLRTSTLATCSNNSYSYNMGIGAGEYLLVSSISSEYNYAALIYNEDAVTVSDYERDGTTAVFYAQNASDTSETVLLPMICYDNYRAYDGAGAELAVSCGDNNRIAVEIPANYAGTVQVRYHFPFLWRAAIFISVITLLSVLGYGVCRRLKKKGISKAAGGAP
ncbi:MAG: hypothetical protein LUD69_08900 [Oscillospiraceae bacterium]|nr:hypothetical protein [Oscillospiraceae bacterium]